VSEVFTRIGKQAQITLYPMNRGLSLIANHQVDGLFPLKKTPERDLAMVYPTQPLLVQDYVFFVRKDSPWKFNGKLESIAGASHWHHPQCVLQPPSGQGIKSRAICQRG
jgi:polar amino acid transport system substrate-binding protein